jgi:histidine ammonia-lyase
MYIFELGKELSPSELAALAQKHGKVSLSLAVEQRVEDSREMLEKYVADGRIIYGVNTSMGGFVNWLVPAENAKQLQNNLINAVATNVGSFLGEVHTRAVMLARITSLSRGNSAISLQNLKVLLELYNKGVLPCIPEKGSLGTSGDLGPLACIALVCTGQWKAKYDGVVMSGEEALRKADITPAELSYKEGLAMINGTSAMTGIACCLVDRVTKTLDDYLLISALSFEGLAAISKPFHPDVHKHKPHTGQAVVAQKIYSYMAESSLIQCESDMEKALQLEQDGSIKPSDKQIEDAYSIRCTPQILGPIHDCVEYVMNVVQNELNSSNDNPLIVPEPGGIYHNGHFHGQYIAMAMDFLSIAVTTLCNLANRRIDRFLDKSNSNGLPPFLCSENAGLRLGLMGGQFMSASVTAENRSLCTPLSIQSLSSTADFQDIVSFGLIAARRADEIFKNTKYVIAFELICAAQAVDIRGSLGLSPETKKLYCRIREVVPFFSQDEVLTDYLENVVVKVIGQCE